ADGTWTAGSWESRTPPSKEPLPMIFGGGFYFFKLFSHMGRLHLRYVKVTFLLRMAGVKPV
ncbi:hypothetical protein HNR77_005059, partial [Paenibacillus sp. JGP012]|uniref:hypothetical protein n=1 Tax=Paenibacillus sp. JGP012 TaxID=2735914 RepID=UPI0017C8CC4B